MKTKNMKMQVIKKSIFTSLAIGLFSIANLASAAVCVDADKDGYVVHASCTIDSCDVTKDDVKSDCSNIAFKKGVEPAECDPRTLDENSSLYDTQKYDREKGKNYNPKAVDVPNNGKDENCDGRDGNDLMSSGGRDLKDIINIVIGYVSYIALSISVLVFIYGGIMYATASGDDAKVGKARKALIGAIIGALVGLFAPSIIGSLINMLA